MAWYTNESTLRIEMTEGDYGVELPLAIEGITFSANDALNFVVVGNGKEIVNKSFENIQDNAITLVITKQETSLLPVGRYSYRLDWYQNNAFMCNLAPSGVFIVSEKAKGVSL